MSAGLLDVNVLLALMQTFHPFHSAATRWFRENASRGFASCSITESSFIRIAARAPEGPLALTQGLRAMERLGQTAGYEFWVLDTPLQAIHPELRAHLTGHQQIPDALLLDLAIRRGGRLVTFDRKLRNLLPPDSPHQASIEVIEP